MTLVQQSNTFIERYKNNVKKIDQNKTNTKGDSITSLRAENRKLKQQVQDLEAGLNPFLNHDQVQIILRKSTWLRLRKISRDNDSVSDLVEKLLQFYMEKRKQERENNFVCFPMQHNK